MTVRSPPRPHAGPCTRLVSVEGVAVWSFRARLLRQHGTQRLTTKHKALNLGTATNTTRLTRNPTPSGVGVISVITLNSISVITLAQAAERNPPVGEFLTSRPFSDPNGAYAHHPYWNKRRQREDTFGAPLLEQTGLLETDSLRFSYRR